MPTIESAASALAGDTRALHCCIERFDRSQLLQEFGHRQAEDAIDHLSLLPTKQEEGTRLWIVRHKCSQRADIRRANGRGVLDLDRPERIRTVKNRGRFAILRLNVATGTPECFWADGSSFPAWSKDTCGWPAELTVRYRDVRAPQRRAVVP